MRLVILSDIHGNLEALEEVLNELETISYDAIYHTGDLVGYGPNPNEVIYLVKERRIKGVRGNYDENVGQDSNSCGCQYIDKKQANLSRQYFEWAKNHTSDEHKPFLRDLPLNISLNTNGRSLKLFHGSPIKTNLYMWEDRPARFFRRIGKMASSEILIFGHTHKPFCRIVDNYHFINAGSVGRPKDGDARACYMIIEAGTKINVKFIRVKYNVNKVIEKIKQLSLPSELSEGIERGI